MQPNLGGSHLPTSRLLNKVEHSLFQQFWFQWLVRVALRMKHSAIEQTLVRYVVSQELSSGEKRGASKVRRLRGRALRHILAVMETLAW
jgi:hypothetical protein